jgi:hypothetical protein
MNKKLNMSIGYLSSSATQNVTNNTDVTIFSAPTLVTTSFPNVYLPTTSTIYLPKGFYYFIECGLKFYRSANDCYIKYAIVDTSNNILSNISQLKISVDYITNASYVKKCYAFIDCIEQSKTIKVRVIESYNLLTSTTNTTTVINGAQDSTSTTRFVHSEPNSRMIIKAWKPDLTNLVNDNYILESTNDPKWIALTATSQLTSSYLNKYATMASTGGSYTYYMPVSPQIDDFVGFYFYGSTGSFIVRTTSTGIYLTGTTSINKYSVRKSFKFQWDGSEWIDIGEFNIDNIIYP